MGPIERIQAEQIDRTQQEEFRKKQLGLAERLEAQGRGEGPSLAGIQLREATDRAIANQMAIARSGGGALARRQASFNTAQLQQDAARQASLARMAEQLQANSQLGNVLEQGRGGDITLATNQANLNQGANISNQQAFNNALAQQAQLNQNASLANQAAFNQRNIAQGNINQALASSGMAANAQIKAAGIGAAAARYGVDAGLYKFNQGLQFEMDKYYQGQGRDDVNSRYNIGNGVNNAIVDSRNRGNEALNNAGGAIVRGSNLIGGNQVGYGNPTQVNANQQSQDDYNAQAANYRPYYGYR
jgi:hypothetical protein